MSRDSLANFGVASLAFVPAGTMIASRPPTSGEAVALLLISLAWATLLFSLPRLSYAAWLHVFLYPFLVFWTGFVVLLGGPPHLETIRVVLSTPAAEVLQWLESRMSWAVVAAGVWIGLLGLTRVIRDARGLPSAARRLMLAISGLTISGLMFWHTAVASSAGQVDTSIDSASRTAWPSGALVVGIDLVRSLLDRSDSRSALSDPHRPVPGVVRLADGARERFLVVFVIGESHRADLMSPSARPDLMPGLSRRARAGTLVELTDLLSASNLTVFSVPAMITGTPGDKLPSGVLGRPSGLGYFKKGDFFTAWISNHADDQFREEGWDAALYPVTRVTPHDDVLLQHFRHVLNVHRERKAVVLHMMGSHFDYDRRYPPGFGRPLAQVSDPRSRVVASYENSVAYSAAVLESLLEDISRLQYPAIVLFASDHGENLLDDERQLIWHGTGQSASKFEFRAAAWVAWNERWEASFPERVHELRAIASRPLTHEHLLGIWLNVGGLLDGRGERFKSVMDGTAETPTSGDRVVFAAGKPIRFGELK